MKKSIIADSILVSKYISGDEKSLEILIKRHKQRIYSFIYSKVYDRDLSKISFKILLLKSSEL
jgi:RNA polymerase sigma-70 factor (ECF subfamily)